jgi:hypothetical protein
MAPSKIMLIRHGEKPDIDKGGDHHGVNENGQIDESDLAVVGWRRAGALCRLFAPVGGRFADPRLETPTQLFAPLPNATDASQRAAHVISPLAALLGLAINQPVGVDGEQELADNVMRVAGVVLIAWEHKRIKDIVHALSNGAIASPHWRGSRFDMILVLTAAPTWKLAQVPQLLLPGDSADDVTIGRDED